MTLSRRQWMGIGFEVLAGAMVLALVVWSYRTTAGFMENAESVSHTHQVIETLERIRSLIDEAESSQRGFLLTGNDQFRTSFDSAVSRIPERLTHLKELTADNLPQHQRVEELEELIKVHLELAQGSLTARAAAGLQAPHDLIAVIFSEQDSAALRLLVQEMKAEERGLLAQRMARTETARHILLALILGGGLLTIILVGLAVYGIRSDVIGRRRAEEILERSRARQAIIGESLPIVLYAAIPTGQYEPTWISQSAERVTGFPLSQFLTDATFWASRLHPEDREATLRMFDALPSTGSLSVEYRWQVADGSFRWFSDRALFVRGPKGEPKEILGLWEDVTERKRLTEALHESKETLEAVFRAAPLAITAVSSDDNVIIWNKAAEQLFGWSSDEVLDHPLPTVPSEKVEEHRQFLDRVIRGETFTGYEVRRKRKDGVWIDVSLSAAPLRDGRGVITGAMGLLEDISERKRAAQQLRIQAQIIDQIHDSVVSTDLEGHVTSWNKGAERLFGYPAAEAMGRHISFVYPPEEHAFLAEQVIAPLKRKGSHEVEVRMRKQTGEDFWAHLALSMLSDPMGKRVGMIGYSMDITDRRRAQTALQESREQLRAFAARLESIREEERTRISREVHDELGQVLTALKCDVMWLSKRLEDGQPADPALLLEKLKSSSMLLDGMHDTVRQIATELRPGVLDELGLPAACEWQINEFRSRTGIQCRLTVVPEDLVVERDRGTALFRILQELLTNVASHAQAPEVWLRLEQAPDGLYLEVRDNGRGITVAEQSSLRSLGLLGIRERARQFNGDVSISGNSGKGTTAIVRFPCLPKEP